LLSKGEIKIANYLKSNNISFEPQKTFSECKNIFPLHYDFYLNDFNILIEYDGIQHFIPKEKFGGEKEFIKLQKRDAIKTQFAKVYGIQLIRIPYTELNNVETILTQIVLLHPQSQHHLLLASTSCSL
jgi:very-short-patch-repair endonuclease